MDFAAAVEAYRSPLARQAMRLSLALSMIEDMARRRHAALAAIAARVTNFPVWRFEGAALSVMLHSGQRNAFSAYGGIGRAFAAPFIAFGRGVASVGDIVRGDVQLWALADALAGVTEALLGSVERVAGAGAAIFAPGRARAGDIVGLLAQASGAISGSLGFVRNVAAQAVSVGLLPGEGERRGAGASASLAESLRTAGRVIVAGLMILPALPNLLETMVREGWLYARRRSLDLMQRLEGRLLAVRRTVIDFAFRDLPGMLAPSPVLLEAARVLVLAQVRFWHTFTDRYLTQLFAEFRRYFTEIAAFLNGWIAAVNIVGSMIDGLMTFDILGWILRVTGLDAIWRMVGARPPSLTIGDILDASATAVREATRVSIVATIALVRGQVPLFMPGLRRKLDLLSAVVVELFQAPAPYPAERSGPPPRIRPMPNVFDTMMGATTIRDVDAAVRAFGRDLSGSVAATLETTASGLDTFSTELAGMAREAATVVPATAIGRFAGEARALSDRLYGPQIADLRQRVSAAGRPAGSGFERWLVTGGFHTIGAVIVGYVSEMRDYWRAQVTAEGDVPVELAAATSPHILARRARLSRVRLSTLTIDCGGRPLDPDLAREIAARFRGAVQEAFVAGERRLAGAAATAG